MSIHALKSGQGEEDKKSILDVSTGKVKISEEYWPEMRSKMLKALQEQGCTPSDLVDAFDNSQKPQAVYKELLDNQGNIDDLVRKKRLKLHNLLTSVGRIDQIAYKQLVGSVRRSVKKTLMSVIEPKNVNGVREAAA